jgi:hypothetical protein
MIEFELHGKYHHMKLKSDSLRHGYKITCEEFTTPDCTDCHIVKPFWSENMNKVSLITEWVYS